MIVFFIIKFTRNGGLINNEILHNILNVFQLLLIIHHLTWSFLPNLWDKFDHIPDNLIILEFSVYYALKHLNIHQSSCDDVLSNRLLVDYAEVLAAPIILFIK
jgi:hypothetical protein